MSISGEASYCQAAVTYLRFYIQVCFSILSMYRPPSTRPASHAHPSPTQQRHRHQHISEVTCGFNSSIDFFVILFLTENVN